MARIRASWEWDPITVCPVHGTFLSRLRTDRNIVKPGWICLEDVLAFVDPPLGDGSEVRPGNDVSRAVCTWTA